MQTPKSALVLSSEKPTQSLQGSWSLVITSSILWNIVDKIVNFLKDCSYCSGILTCVAAEMSKDCVSVMIVLISNSRTVIEFFSSSPVSLEPSVDKEKEVSFHNIYRLLQEVRSKTFISYATCFSFGHLLFLCYLAISKNAG